MVIALSTLPGQWDMSEWQEILFTRFQTSREGSQRRRPWFCNSFPDYTKGFIFFLIGKRNQICFSHPQYSIYPIVVNGIILYTNHCTLEFCVIKEIKKYCGASSNKYNDCNVWTSSKHQSDPQWEVVLWTKSLQHLKFPGSLSRTNQLFVWQFHEWPLKSNDFL